MPPCPYWQHDRYVVRRGYWLTLRQGWVWVPSHYVWTPRGYIFIRGHWDYALDRRGVLFAPVYFPRVVYRAARLRLQARHRREPDAPDGRPLRLPALLPLLLRRLLRRHLPGGGHLPVVRQLPPAQVVGPDLRLRPLASPPHRPAWGEAHSGTTTTAAAPTGASVRREPTAICCTGWPGSPRPSGRATATPGRSPRWWRGTRARAGSTGSAPCRGGSGSTVRRTTCARPAASASSVNRPARRRRPAPPARARAGRSSRRAAAGRGTSPDNTGRALLRGGPAGTLPTTVQPTPRPTGLVPPTPSTGERVPPPEGARGRGVPSAGRGEPTGPRGGRGPVVVTPRPRQPEVPSPSGTQATPPPGRGPRVVRQPEQPQPQSRGRRAPALSAEQLRQQQWARDRQEATDRLRQQHEHSAEQARQQQWARDQQEAADRRREQQRAAQRARQQEESRRQQQEQQRRHQPQQDRSRSRDGSSARSSRDSGSEDSGGGRGRRSGR